MAFYIHDIGSSLQSTWAYLLRHLNFFRIHVLFFLLTPLILSGVFYAANGEYPISYTDSLFNCVSAMTVCGIASVDLSLLTPFQQFLLFLQMCLGSPVAVSWVMIYVRRRFFAEKFRHMVESRISSSMTNRLHTPVKVSLTPRWKRILSSWMPGRGQTYGDVVAETDTQDGRSNSHLRPDMIRRVDNAPRLVNPSGWISETQEELSPELDSHDPPHEGVVHVEAVAPERSVSRPRNSIHFEEDPIPTGDNKLHTEHGDRNSSCRDTSGNDTSSTRNVPARRTQTVEFQPPPHSNGPRFDEQKSEHPRATGYDRRSLRHPTVSIQHSIHGPALHQRVRPVTLHQDMGGFPMPDKIIARLFRKIFPKLQRRLSRTMTIPRTRTLASQHGPTTTATHVVPYITFDAVVGRNSAFKNLTREQIEELGGVEYRALTALLWIVGGYHIGLQAIAFVIIAPYMSESRWRSDLTAPPLHRPVNPVWYSGFQVVSSYTNTGMSLQDESMVPFQTAYPMIFFMVVLILAGNTAFPCLLRLVIWIITKIVPRRSRLNETLRFLLDHPRRCFVYLFPSHQTWFLVTVLVALNATDWFFFLVLDIGNPAVETIPVGTRVVLGLLQATAVRSSGFASVSLAALAPAVKVLYVLMMYVSVYPVAMSVRATNVYEDQSLGVYEDEDDMPIDENFNPDGSRVQVWGRYLAGHMRKQLSFDMWWLGLGLFLVCIVERDNLMDSSKVEWFSIFTILFELVSAYGTVGLSLGVPYANYSFSGALRALSKLILCAVMLRGRHRGLPVAIDRAVMLPSEFQESLDGGIGEREGTARPVPRTFTRSAHEDGDHELHPVGTRHRPSHRTLRRSSEASLHENQHRNPFAHDYAS